MWVVYDFLLKTPRFRKFSMVYLWALWYIKFLLYFLEEFMDVYFYILRNLVLIVVIHLLFLVMPLLNMV